MYCKHCGQQIEDSVAYCSFCGGAQKIVQKDDVKVIPGVESPITDNKEIEVVTSKIPEDESKQKVGGFWWAWWKGLMAFGVGLFINFIPAFPMLYSYEKVISIVGSVIVCVLGVIALFEGRKGRLLGVLGIFFVIVFFKSNSMLQSGF